MLHSFIRGLMAFILPGGVLFGTALAASLQPGFPHWVALLNPLLPYASVILALFIGWRFDRSRLVFATIIIGLSAWAFGHFSTDAGISQTVSLLLPFNIALLSTLKERGLFTWHGLIRWLVIGVQPLGIGLAVNTGHQAWLAYPHQAWLPLETLGTLPMSQATLLVFALALCLTAWFGIRQHNSLENGLFWALGLILYTLLSGQPLEATMVLFATALLILTAAVLEVSHSMAFRDELTGLPGRRALNQELLKLGSRYTVAMLDQ